MKEQAQIKKLIKAELAKGNYAGYGGDSEFLSYNWKQFVNWCSGQLLIAIGDGQFRSTLDTCLRLSTAWEQRWAKKRELERKYGIDD